MSVLYNTYWVRFNYKLFRHEDAVKNTMILFNAAKAAGVERIVHVSITNPSEDSGLEYFSGKARLEKSLIESSVSYAILRPWVGYVFCRLLGKIVNDVIITRDEIEGLMDNLLYVDSEAAGQTDLTGWIREHAETLGRKYTSELARRKDRKSEYKAN